MAWLSIALLLLGLALLPAGIKWLQRRVGIHIAASSNPTLRIVSSLAVGVHQRIVTVEVGPDGQKTWLILGISPQTITCLHTVAVGAGPQTPVHQVHPVHPAYPVFATASHTDRDLI